MQMQRLTKYYSLFELEPSLKREWHPSRNAGLNPGKVTIAYRKKVWWICNSGHEWKASVKCRLKGNGCPFCGQNDMEPIVDGSINGKNPKGCENNDFATSIKTEFIFETADSENYMGENFRRGRRFRVNILAVVEIPVYGHWFYTSVRDISNDGLSFETEAFIEKGTNLIINFEQPLLPTLNKTCCSIIRWCRRMDNEDPSVSAYRVGAQIY
jgi:hypothetical protein